MTDSPTIPLPVTAAQVQANRRKGQQFRARCADLDRALRPTLLTRPAALEIAARMSAWRDCWPEENDAIKVLMRRHGLTSSMIREESRRLPGSA